MTGPPPTPTPPHFWGGGAEGAGGAETSGRSPVEEIHRDRAPLIEAAMGAEAELVRPRFARGCRCFAVMTGGEIAGYGWLSTGPEWIGELQLEIRPRKGEAYIWNCVTLDAHRRRGVFRSLVAGIADAARRSGVERVWIGSVAIPAENALGPLGFVPAMRFRSAAALGVHVMLVTPERSTLGRDALHVVPVRRGVQVAGLRRRKH